MRIALAQILARHRSGRQPRAGRGLHPTRRRRRRPAGGVPGGDDVPVRGAAGAGRRTARRAVGRRGARHRRARRHHRGRRHVHPAPTTAGSPTRCSPPAPASTPTTTRSTSTTRSGSPSPTPSRRAANRSSITVDGVGVGLTLCYDIRFPELYIELADRGAQLITVQRLVGRRAGQARAVDAAGAGPGAGLHAASSPPSGRPTPATSSAATAPTGVGGSLVASPLGEVLASAGPDPATRGGRRRPRQRARRSATPSGCCATAQSSLRFDRAESRG